MTHVMRTGRRVLTCLGAALIAYCGVVAEGCFGTPTSPSPSPSPTSALMLTVTKNGAGSGTVTSSPSGIACGTTCSQGYPSGTAMTLTATPDIDSVFIAWTGGCSGTGSCQFAVTAATAVTATFDKIFLGPYTVKQTQTLGGEVLSGGVCKVTTPFSVTSAAPNVTFAFNFVPGSAKNGAWTYAYSIPSAGETHNASGTYSISLPDQDGTLVLSMTGSDNVSFHGFSGPFPVRYQFSLVPSNFGPCP